MIANILLLVLHPVHLSVTNIEFIENKKYFEISIRLFSDDFETALSHHFNQTIQLKNSQKYPQKIINEYITQNLKLEINGKWVDSKKYLLKKIEQKDITIWLYYRIPFKDKIDSITIKNTLLFNIYYDQKNMLIFSEKKQSTYNFYNQNSIQKINL